MMLKPDLEDIHNEKAFEQLEQSEEKYLEQAREWTQKYAT